MTPVRPRRAAAVLLAGTLLAGTALTACGDGATARVADWHLAEPVHPRSTVVPVRVEHRPACESVEGAAVTETADAVEITVRVAVLDLDEGWTCPELAVSSVLEARLAEPLGDRSLGGPGHREPPD